MLGRGMTLWALLATLAAFPEAVHSEVGERPRDQFLDEVDEVGEHLMLIQAGVQQLGDRFPEQRQEGKLFGALAPFRDIALFVCVFLSMENHGCAHGNLLGVPPQSEPWISIIEAVKMFVGPMQRYAKLLLEIEIVPSTLGTCVYNIFMYIYIYMCVCACICICVVYLIYTRLHIYICAQHVLHINMGHLPVQEKESKPLQVTAQTQSMNDTMKEREAQRVTAS